MTVHSYSLEVYSYVRSPFRDLFVYDNVVQVSPVRSSLSSALTDIMPSTTILQESIPLSHSEAGVGVKFRVRARVHVMLDYHIQPVEAERGRFLGLPPDEIIPA